MSNFVWKLDNDPIVQHFKHFLCMQMNEQKIDSWNVQCYRSITSAKWFFFHIHILTFRTHCASITLYFSAIKLGSVICLIVLQLTIHILFSLCFDNIVLLSYQPLRCNMFNHSSVDQLYFVLIVLLYHCYFSYQSWRCKMFNRSSIDHLHFLHFVLIVLLYHCNFQISTSEVLHV